MTRWTRNLFRTNTAATKAPAKTRLGMEALERRDVLSSPAVAGPTLPKPPVVITPGNLAAPVCKVALADGTLTVTGTALADDVAFEAVAGNKYRVTAKTGNATKTESFDRPAVERVVFRGKAGGDVFANWTGRPCSAYGDDGNDLLIGGSGNDLLVGGKGFDNLDGKEGADTLVSVDGAKDIVVGGFGLDTFWTDQASLDAAGEASDAEKAGKRVHRIAAFSDLAQEEQGQQGDVTWSHINYTKVGKVPNAPDLLDPVKCAGDTHSKNFAANPLFGKNGPRRNDIDQNRIPDCWLMSALGGVAADTPDVIRQAVTELGDGTFAVRFFRNDQAVYYRVDADLVTKTAAGTELRYAGFGHDGSIWVPILEKAYAFFRRDAGTGATHQGPNGEGALVGWYQSLSYGKSADAGKALGLTAYTKATADYATKADYLTALKSKINAGYVVVLGGPGTAEEWSATADKRSNAHAWMVVGYTYGLDGKATGLKVRNPYGSAGKVYGDPDRVFGFDAIYMSSKTFAVIEC
ncbi:MAG: hypothetical protein K2X82_27415 [Gemmataceae bacterium]|nr:hypothetical protein [Gemmataceae bacterium]